MFRNWSKLSKPHYIPWPEENKIQGDLQMGIKADVEKLGQDIAAEAKTLVVDAKAEFEKVFAKAQTEAVTIEGSVAQELTDLKAVVLDHAKKLASSVGSASKADLAVLETKLDSLIAKIGIKL